MLGEPSHTRARSPEDNKQLEHFQKMTAKDWANSPLTEDELYREQDKTKQKASGSSRLIIGCKIDWLACDF